MTTAIQERPTTDAGGRGSIDQPLVPVLHGEGDDSYAHDGIEAAEAHANSLGEVTSQSERVSRALRVVDLTQRLHRRYVGWPGLSNVVSIGGRLTVQKF